MYPWPDSLWGSTTPSVDRLPSLKEDIHTDLLIIGGGYTGLSTALHGGSMFSSIVIIDQAQPGWGCSGRNGGQINPQWKSSLSHLKSQYSQNEFDDFIKLLNTSAQNVFSLIEQHNIDCQGLRSGALIPGRGTDSRRYLQEWASYWKDYGARVQLLGKSETTEAIGTKVYDNSLLLEEGGSLQPLAFTRGLVSACQSQSVDIYGDTRAQTVTARGNGWLVKTEFGLISCNSLVIATNGYTGRLWPGLRQNLYPVASMISATEPLADDAFSSILPAKQSVAEYAGLPFYYRLDEQNRFIMGGRGTRSGGVGSMDPRHLHRAAIKLFPQLEIARWTFNWAGYVGVTLHQKPLLLRLGENAYAGLGYNGRGITMATAMGRQLTRALAGKSTLLPVESLEKNKFYAFYRLGVTGRILYGEWLDRRQGLR